MKIYWQVEEGGVAYKQSYTRREPKNNILRLLRGKEWEGCRFQGKKVIDGKGKEVRVIAGPNYNIPIMISEEYVLIINILWEDPTAEKDGAKEKLINIACVDIETDGKSVGEIIAEIVENVSGDYSEKYWKMIDLIYMPGKIFEDIYRIKAGDKKMNLTTLIKKIYAVKKNSDDVENDTICDLLKKYEIKVLF